MRSRVSWWSIALYYAMLLGSFGFLAWCVSQPARAHDDYPQECCGGYDCAPVEAARDLGNGQLWISNGKAEAVTDEQTKFRTSPDNRVHACIVNLNEYADLGGSLSPIYQVRCILIPGNS